MPADDVDFLFQTNDVVAVREDDPIKRASLDRLDTFEPSLPAGEPLRGKLGVVVNQLREPGVVRSYKDIELTRAYEVRFTYRDATEKKDYSFSAFLWEAEVRELTEEERTKYGDETLFIVRGSFPKVQIDVDYWNTKLAAAKKLDKDIPDRPLRAGQLVYIYRLMFMSSELLYCHQVTTDEAGKMGLEFLTDLTKGRNWADKMIVAPSYLPDYMTYAYISESELVYRLEEDKWRLLRTGEVPWTTVCLWSPVGGVFVHSDKIFSTMFAPPTSGGIPFLNRLGKKYYLEYKDRTKKVMVVHGVFVDCETKRGGDLGEIDNGRIWVFGEIGGKPFDQVFSVPDYEATIFGTKTHLHGENIDIQTDDVLFVLGDTLYHENETGDEYICNFSKGVLWNISGRYMVDSKRVEPRSLRMYDVHPFAPRLPPIMEMYCMGDYHILPEMETNVAKITADTGIFEVNGGIEGITVVGDTDGLVVESFRTEPMGLGYMAMEHFSFAFVGNQWFRGGSSDFPSLFRDLADSAYFARKVYIVTQDEEMKMHDTIHEIALGERLDKILVEFDSDGGLKSVKVGRGDDLYAAFGGGESTEVFQVKSVIKEMLVSIEDLLFHGGD